MANPTAIMDGNEAAAYVAYRLSDLCLVDPVAPATSMSEQVDLWSHRGVRNLWGAVPHVEQMQGAAGAAGALHGALQTGALATTFTTSQALVRMMPSLYRIAGELNPAVIHVATRTVPCHGTSIYSDHSDVMAVRQTGFGILGSSSVQEAHDLALIAHVASLESRIPFLHFFDGFRTSHEMHDLERLERTDLRRLLPETACESHRGRALDPGAPTTRGTAQNPDVFFQAREAANPFYEACPGIVQEVMDRFEKHTGRAYRLFEYTGHPEAERVLILMGSGAETARETLRACVAAGDRVGVVTVRLYRPFDASALLAALPPTVKGLAVLDRTKEPGAPGEPLYLDVVSALHGGTLRPRVRGGRYGLGGKSFTPGMIHAVLQELDVPTATGAFTVGIRDDVTRRSLPMIENPVVLSPETTQAVFFGLGADGTVGAIRNSVRIIGRESGYHVQAYFLHDSKRAGSITMSHLRFGPHPIAAPYLVERANFIGCHHLSFVDRFNVLRRAGPGATLLVNSPFPPEDTWQYFPRPVQEKIIHLGLRVFIIDACGLARRLKLASRINTIMQTCFFALTGIVPREIALNRIKETIRNAYKRKGQVIVDRNWQAVDCALEALTELKVPANSGEADARVPLVPDAAPQFVQAVTAELLGHHGGELPVSAFPPDGVWPSGTSIYEKRRISQYVPVWDSQACIQCGWCVMMCPHACIRAKHVDVGSLDDAPDAFASAPLRGRGVEARRYVLQVYEEDCTGCGLCVESCPARNRDRGGARALVPNEAAPRRDRHRDHLRFFESLPDPDPRTTNGFTIRGVQFLPPRFEFSGACAGCGETPYLKLLTQLFGNRVLIANATGCSSTFGGHLPTSPWTTDAEGRGPAWSAALDVHAAEFGYGFRLSLDARSDEDAPGRSVWIVGGDGWACGAGFGGLDHVLTSGRDINVLILDTEICSSTGGQVSKSTPCGVVGKFANRGKGSPKRELGRVGLGYAGVYVSQVALGANPQQCIRAFREAEAHTGPSLILAYCPCIAHGFNLKRGLQHQRMAVQSGHWPLFRRHPDLSEEPRLILDSVRPSLRFDKFAYGEVRFNLLPRTDTERSRALLADCERQVAERWAFLEACAERKNA